MVPPFLAKNRQSLELFKPFTNSASLGVKIKKKIFRFGFEVFWGERHK